MKFKVYFLAIFLSFVLSFFIFDVAFAFFGKSVEKMEDIDLCHKSIGTGNSHLGTLTLPISKPYFYLKKNQLYVNEAKKRRLTVAHCYILTLGKECYNDCWENLLNKLELPYGSSKAKVFEKFVCPNLKWLRNSTVKSATWWESTRVIEFAVELGVGCNGLVKSNLKYLADLVNEKPIVSMSTGFYSTEYGKKETIDADWVKTLTSKIVSGYEDKNIKKRSEPNNYRNDYKDLNNWKKKIKQYYKK